MANLTPQVLSQPRRLGFLFKDTVMYGGASALSKAFGLITFPLLARHLTVADYGILDFFLVFSGLLALFLIFGQDSAVARYYYVYEDHEERRQLISQSLVYQGVGLIIAFPVLWIGAENIGESLITTPQAPLFFRIILLQVPFLLLINFSQNLLKWTFARGRFLLMSLGYTVVQAVSLVVAVVHYKAGIEGILLVSCAANALFGLLGIYLVRGFLVWPRGFKRLQEMLPFALPYGVVCVIGAFSPTLERAVIDRMLGPDQLGLYAAATKIAMLLGILVSAFQTAWGPFALSLHKQADAAPTFNLVLKIFSWAMVASVFVLCALATPLLRFLASDRYASAGVVVFPLAMGLGIQATGWITDIGIGIAKQSVYTFYANMLALACTFIGILALTPAFGLLGVGFGVMLGHAARAGLSALLAQKAYPLPWEYASTIGLISLSVAVGLLAIWAKHSWGDWTQPLIFSLGFILLIAAGWGLLLTRLERAHVLERVRNGLLTSV